MNSLLGQLQLVSAIFQSSGISNILGSTLQPRLYLPSFTQWSLRNSLQEIWPCHALPDLSSFLELWCKPSSALYSYIVHLAKPSTTWTTCQVLLPTWYRAWPLLPTFTTVLTTFLLAFWFTQFPVEWPSELCLCYSTASWNSIFFHIPPTNQDQRPKNHVVRFIRAVTPTLSASFCICYLSHCCDQIPYKNQVKKCLFWLRVCGDIVKSIIWGGRPWRQERSMADPHFTYSQETGECLCSALSSLLFYSAWDPTPWCAIHTQGEPSFLKSLRNHPCRYIQRCISKPFKLTIKSNHQRQGQRST